MNNIPPMPKQKQAAREVKCDLCGHTWKTKLKRDPQACPRCKRYDWKKKTA